MNLFERISKKRALNKAKQKYFKKKEKPIFFFSTRNISPKAKRGIKIGFIISLPLLLLGIGTTIGVYEHLQDQDKLKDEVIVPTETITRRVYLLSKDNITIPVSIKMSKFNSVEEEILEVFSLLKEDSKLNSSYFQGVIPKDTMVLSLQIDEGLLTLNLSEEFLNQSFSQTSIESSLTYTMLQFEEINKLSLCVEDKYQSDILTTSIGINVSNYNLTSIVDKELMTYYYQKEYGGTNFYIPKSIYVEKANSDNLTFFNGLSYRLPGTYGLKKIDTYSYLSSSQVEADTMTFAIDKNGLADENLVKKDLYDLILLSMDIMGRSDTVSFTLEGEEIAVEGIVSSEEYQVSSISYNEVEL